MGCGDEVAFFRLNSQDLTVFQKRSVNAFWSVKGADGSVCRKKPSLKAS